MRQTFRPAVDHPRTFLAETAAVPFAWLPFAVTVVPERDGQLRIFLNGPYEESTPGKPWRQDVLWDDLTLEAPDGAVIDARASLDFEQAVDGKPKGWTDRGGELLDDPAVVRSGKLVARTWYGGGWELSVACVADQPFTVRGSVRSFAYDDAIKVTRVGRSDSPAFTMAGILKRGVNLGNDLDSPRGQNWGAIHDADDLARIARAGFDHVRIPIRWSDYCGPAPDFKLEEAIVARANKLLDAAAKNGLRSVIDVHHFEEFTSDPKAHTEKWLAIWRQLTRLYKRRSSDQLIFELLNEPKDHATSEVMNQLYDEAIKQIRAIDAERLLVIGPGKWNSASEIVHLRVPKDDRIIATVHTYEPHLFTHQGADFGGPDVKVTGLVFPGPPQIPKTPDPTIDLKPHVVDWVRAYNETPLEGNPSSIVALSAKLDLVVAWSKASGVPVYLGEFGCLEEIDIQSRARYAAAVRRAAESRGLGWAWWSWRSRFRCWDEQDNALSAGFEEALFGD